MSLIKEVRLKYQTTNSNGYVQSLTNYKLCLNDGVGERGFGKNDRFITVKTVDKNTNQESVVTTPPLGASYPNNRRYKDYSDDDIIEDWVNNQDKQGNNFSILQNPWQDDLPVKRNYGFGDYYLSNGSRVNIKWTSVLDFTYQNGEIKTAYGYEYDEDTDTYIDSNDGDVLPDYLFSGGRPGFNLFGKITSNFIVIGGEKWSDDNGNEIGTIYVDNQKLPPVGGYSFGLEKSYDELLDIHVGSVLDGNPTTYFEADPSGDGFVPVYNFYGEPYDDIGLPYYVSSIKGEAIEKKVTIWPDSESEDVDTYGYFQISEDNKIKPFSEVKIGSTQSESTEKSWRGNIADRDILDEIISIWKKQVPNYDLEFCNIDQLTSSGGSEYCRLIEYKSPVAKPDNPTEPEEEPLKTEESEQGNNKIKLSVVLPEDLELRVKEDLNELKVYIGDPPLSPSDFVFQDDFDNLEELDPEYYESDFAGFEELSEPPFSEYEPGAGDGAHEDSNVPVGGTDNVVSGNGGPTPGSSVNAEGARINVTKTFSGWRRKIIDAYGWPILVEKKGNEYYGIKSGDNGGRNVYKIDYNYKKKWTSTFKYVSKSGKVIVNRKLHKDMQAPLKYALEKIEAAGFISGVSKISASVYARDTTGAPGVLSGHSFGVAMDFNSDKYGYGNAAYKRYLEDVKNPSSKNYKYAKAIQILASTGKFYWGGNYSGTKDTHHFTFNPFKS